MITSLALRLDGQLERLASRLLGEGGEALLELVGVVLVVLAFLPLAQLGLEVGQGGLAPPLRGGGDKLSKDHSLVCRFEQLGVRRFGLRGFLFRGLPL